MTNRHYILLAIFLLSFSLIGLLSKQKIVDIALDRNTIKPDMTYTLDGDFQYGLDEAYFNNRKLSYFPKDPIAYIPPQVLGETTDQKWIDISLSQQKLMAKEGGNTVMEFPISSGKWAPTPKGDFRIWIKLRYSTMSGGNKADNTYYYLPNVPYVMFFYGPFGIHGTYWHNNFGTPMSHGCVNLSTDNAGRLFAWVNPSLPSGKNSVRSTTDNPGTRVIIRD